MTSTVHEEPAPTGRASELQRYLAWSPALLGGVVALRGLILAGGGAYLAWLGGSLYYVLVGAMLVAAGYLLNKAATGRQALLVGHAEHVDDGRRRRKARSRLLADGQLGRRLLHVAALG